MKNRINLLIAALILMLIFVGCTTVVDHKKGVSTGVGDELTVGKVQKEIKKGMSGAEVAEALGSPNIVTKDEGGNETWVYDKIATEVSYSESQSAWFLILAGEANQSGALSQTQKTLTVVIKFNDKSKVDTFSYHYSKF